MKKIIVAILATATIVSGSLTATPQKVEAGVVDTAKGILDSAISKFRDVKGHWAQNVIAKAFELKLITGYSNGTFKPNGKITRAEFATILSRATKLESAASSNPFRDLKGHWAEPSVSQLVGQGFINPGNYPYGFKPNTELTRYEMMKWIANGLVKSNDSFKQAFEDTKETLLPTPEAVKGQIKNEQIPYMALVRGTGIIEGYTDGSLRPSNTTTRAEVASILLRYMDVEGKNADSYTALDELREVGTTATNLTTISDYKYDSNSVKFSELPNIKFVNNSGHAKIHRFIVVDTRTSKPKGVYAPLFLGEDYRKGSYTTFIEMTLTSNLEKSDLLTFKRGFDSSLIGIGRIDLKLAQERGLVTLPLNSTHLIKKGKPVKFWTTHSLVAEGNGYDLVSESGSKMSISIY